MVSDVFSDPSHLNTSQTYFWLSSQLFSQFPYPSETIVLYYLGIILPILWSSVQTSIPRWNKMEQRIRFSVTKHIYCKIKVLIPFSCRIKRQPYISELDFPGPFISQVDSLQTDYTDPLALFAVSRQLQLGSSKWLIRLSWVSTELPAK